MTLLWNSLTEPRNHRLNPPKGIDGGLYLGVEENVSAAVTLKYEYDLNDSTPLSNDTWKTNRDMAMTLDAAHSYQVVLAVYFNTVTFSTNSSRVDLTVRQQRLATDTTTAPIIGAGSITPDSLKPTFPATYKGLWFTLPIQFVPYGDQPTRALTVNIAGANTTTLDKATLLLAPSISLYREVGEPINA